MRTINTVAEWLRYEQEEKLSQKRVGFVPTMGALHNGHQSLIEKSIQENEVTVVSIFVNPTQFNDKEDLKKYPQSHDEDVDVLSRFNVDVLFYPEYPEIYPDDFNYKISEQSFSKKLCGASRPGHFDGVLTVVMKLLNIVKPHRSYFGEKDYQQLLLIRDMCVAFFVSTEIIGCPTVRDDDGLALSSRNKLLSVTDRKKASLFPKLLKSEKNSGDVIRELEKEGITVDYIEDIDSRRFGAVYFGNVRLIDNVPVPK